MSTEANKALIARYVEQFKNDKQFAVFADLFAPDFRHHFDLPGLPDNLAGFQQVGQAFLAAFPDVRVDLHDLIAEGDFVVERNSVTATHTGAYQGIAPTDRTVRWTEIHIYRIAGGRIAENWPAVNFERIMRQITAP